jgi:hypothetical protein
VDRVVGEGGGRVVTHIGDGALSAFDGPAKAIRCAEVLREGVTELGVELLAGVHTGECEAIGDDLGGLAVHIWRTRGRASGTGRDRCLEHREGARRRLGHAVRRPRRA